MWNDEAHESFDNLKKALCEALVLALPLFDIPFIVETDASGQGIGVVLMQNGHHVAYISRHLKGKQIHLSIYEKDLLAVVLWFKSGDIIYSLLTSSLRLIKEVLNISWNND